jgi:hypothetical protein
MASNPGYVWHAWLLISALLLAILARPIAWLARLVLRLPVLVFIAAGVCWTSFVAENLAGMMRGTLDEDLAVNSFLWIGPNLLYMTPLWWLASGYAVSRTRIAALAGLPGVVTENGFALPAMVAAGQTGPAIVAGLNVHAVYAAMFALPVIMGMAARRDSAQERAALWRQGMALILMPIGLYAGKLWVEFWRSGSYRELLNAFMPT